QLDTGVNGYTSITIGADGLGLISYYASTDLRIAHCSNVACTAATTITADSTNDVGLYTSIVVGTDGLGLVSEYDATNSDLRVAHCADVSCTSATSVSVDT